MYVNHFFELDSVFQDYLQSLRPNFGYNGFGEAVFYRTYSRMKKDGSQEHWPDVVIRNTHGTFSVRKDFYKRNRIPWDEQFWQEYAQGFALAMFKMHWLPPGRGLWAMGSEFVYERGAMALYNCAYTNLGNNSSFSDDIGWLMDSLMHGVGVGFGPLRDDLTLHEPQIGTYEFIVPDSREGWVEIIMRTLDAFLLGTQLPDPKFHLVRPANLPIKGFGGVSSGPEPLERLCKQIVVECYRFLRGEVDVVQFKTNIANLVGCCVVAGNVRRSAEIACGGVQDDVFLDLKNYSRFPEREAWGWMSNNSVILDTDSDFDCLGEVARRVVTNGEPGIINKRNLKFARIGKNQNGLRPDRAVGFNPCGEIPLEHREVCNLSETCPTRCESIDDWYKACEYATFYCSTVTLLPTHQPLTNRVIARNRRIGVGIIDYTGWKHTEGIHKLTRYLRNGYNIVRETNRWLNAEAGIPESIRVTTIKPGGTVPKLVGKTSGIGHPTFRYTLRRLRVQQGTPYHSVLVRAHVPSEPDAYSANTDCFEYPILQGPAKPADHVSLWEQANNLVLMQREWSDNAVSNTLYFRPKWRLIEHYCIRGYGAKTGANECDDLGSWINHYVGDPACFRINKDRESNYIVPDQHKVTAKYEGEKMVEVRIYEFDPRHEEDDIEPVLASIAPLIKSASVLPHSPRGVYRQMPEEGITEQEFEARLAMISSIDWTDFKGSDGIDERYCNADSCEVGGVLQ